MAKFELMLKLSLETINSAGNLVRYYDDYALDGTTLLGKTTITTVNSTTPSIAAIGSSSGSLTSSNSNESNVYLQYHAHTVLYIENHHYIFDSSYVLNNNDFIIPNNLIKYVKNQPDPLLSNTKSAASPASLVSTNNYATQSFSWNAAISNKTGVDIPDKLTYVGNLA